MQRRLASPVPGTRLERICIDYSIELVFMADEYECSVRIESAFSLTRDRRTRCLTPGQRSELGDVLDLLHADLVAFSYTEDGVATLDFGARGVIAIPPDPHYEAWQFSDMHGWLVVSMPGGGTAIWSGRPPATDAS